MRSKSGSSGGLVYSTEGGRMCSACRMPFGGCACAAAKAARPAAGGAVRVSRETGGRGGKTVTIVRGLGLGEAALDVLAKRLRAACATGGTSKEGVLVLQGDHVDRVVALLQAEGLAAKRAGG